MYTVTRSQLLFSMTTLVGDASYCCARAPTPAEAHADILAAPTTIDATTRCLLSCARRRAHCTVMLVIIPSPPNCRPRRAPCARETCIDSLMRRACQRRGEHRRDVRSPTTDHRLQHAARTC